MTMLATKSDAQIKSDVLSELRWDTRIDETEVGVQVHGGVVTLTGWISNFAKKLGACEAAHRVSGVLDVVDSMKVRLPSHLLRTDEDIAGAVRRALMWDVTVPDERIKTTVAGGVVTLDGSVDTWAQRRDAQSAVERLAGVTNVVNLIGVKPRRVDGEALKEQIQRALERQADREAARIHIGVKDGVVTLTGAVRSWAERNAVDQVAACAGVLRRIDDRLIVDPYL